MLLFGQIPSFLTPRFKSKSFVNYFLLFSTVYILQGLQLIVPFGMLETVASCCTQGIHQQHAQHTFLPSNLEPDLMKCMSGFKGIFHMKITESQVGSTNSITNELFMNFFAVILCIFVSTALFKKTQQAFLVQGTGAMGSFIVLAETEALRPALFFFYSGPANNSFGTVACNRERL